MLNSLYHWVGVAVVWSNVGVLLLLGGWQLATRRLRPGPAEEQEQPL